MHRKGSIDGRVLTLYCGPTILTHTSTDEFATVMNTFQKPLSGNCSGGKSLSINVSSLEKPSINGDFIS